jgi:hypothetical protein
LFSHLSGNSVAIRSEKILAMLVESGFTYCCIWVRHRSLSFFPGFSETNPCGRSGALSNIYISGITRSLLRCHERLHSISLCSYLNFPAEFLVSFSDSPVLPCGGQGLYPTVIIVALQKTPTLTITIQRSTHFSDDPHFTPVDVRIPMSDIYSHREGTHTDSDITVLHSPSLYARNKP